MMGEFPSPRSWNPIYILFHVLLSIGMLMIALFVYATWLTTGESLKALGGSVVILVSVIVVLYPLLREIVYARIAYLVYKDDLDINISIARDTLIRSLAEECITALYKGKEPKIQLLNLMRLAIISNYPLVALESDLARYARTRNIEPPRVTVDSSWNPRLVHCIFKPAGAVASNHVALHLDGVSSH